MNHQQDKIKLTIGLDCHPDSFTAAVLAGDRPTEAKVTVRTDAISLDRLEQWFTKHCQGNETVVLEASANSFEIYSRLSTLGFSTLVLCSDQVGRISKTNFNNDKVSAVRIARVYLSGLSDQVWVPDSGTRERREVFTSYLQAVKDHTRSVNRIKGMLNEHTLRLPRGLKLTSESGREAALNAKKWTSTQYTLLEELLLDLARANAKRNHLRKIMAREILSNSKMLQLVRIFGLRHITVYALMAMIGDINRFSSAKKLAAYFGLSPKYKQSGQMVKYGSISRSCRQDVRPMLVQAAHVIFQHKVKTNGLFKWAWHLGLRKGRKIAVIAVARRIVVAVFYLLNGKPFKPKELTNTLTEKIKGLAKVLGIKEIRQNGFQTYQKFVEQKLEILQERTGQPT